VGAGPAHDPGIPARRVVLRDQQQLCRADIEDHPLFQLDAHFSRDLTEHLWGALDAAWYYGGQSSINGVEGSGSTTSGSTHARYTINDNLNLTSATSQR